MADFDMYIIAMAQIRQLIYLLT